MKLPPLDERYKIEQAVGEGATSTVFRVWDSVCGNRLVLKLQKSGDPTARLLFQQEYWTMRRLDHPGLIRAWDYGITGDQAFFTMDLVAGPCISTNEPLTVSQTKDILDQLCPIVGYLHAQGLVHGDLKIENLRYDETGGLRLLDLGLLQTAGSRGKRRGTLEYMAPEVFKGEPADPRSDLYAIGVMAYRLLSGRAPFPGADPAAIIRAQDSVGPKSLVELRPDVPPELASGVMRCLAKHPHERPGTVGEFLDAVGGKQSVSPYLVLGCTIHGRANELGTARDLIQSSLDGAMGPVLLVAGAEQGKSRLLQELAAQFRDGECPVVAVSGASQGPFALLKSLLDGLESTLDDAMRWNFRWQALRSLTSGWRTAPEPLPDSSAQEGRIRLAIASLLSDVTAERRLVIAIDDWDHADEASVSILSPLVSRSCVGLAWLLTARTIESELWPSVKLHGLGVQEVESLLGETLGQAPPVGMRELLTTFSGGNPGYCRRILAHWRRSGALFLNGAEWRLDPNLARRIPDDLEALVHAHLSTLRPEGLAILRAGAILGEDFSLDSLAQVVEGPIFDGLAELETMRYLERDGPRYRLIGSAREWALTALPDEEAATLHEKVFALCAGQDDLASLTEAARHAVKARLKVATETVLRAAAENMAQGSSSTAHGLLRQLDLETLEPPERQETERLLGDALRLRGQSDLALDHYQVALAHERQREDWAALCRDLTSSARAALALSRWVEARQYVSEAIPAARRVGNAYEEARALATAGRAAIFEGDRETARFALESAYELASATNLNSVAANVAALLATMADPGDTAALTLLEEAANLQRGLENPVGLIDALINLADRCMTVGKLDRAKEALGEALSNAQQVGSRVEESFVLVNLAQVELHRGWPNHAKSHADRARDIAVSLRQSQPEGFARVFLASACLGLGHYPDAYAQAKLALDVAIHTGNHYLEVSARIAQAEIYLHLGEVGDSAQAIEAARASAATDLEALGRLDLLSGLFLIMVGDFESAQSTLLAGFDDNQRKGLWLQVGAYHQALGYLAWLEGDVFSAAHQAQGALRVWQECGATGMAADAKWLLGSVALLNGRQDEARQNFASAWEISALAKRPLLAAICALGLGRSRVGAGATRWTQRGMDALRDLRSYVTHESFFRWPERQVFAPGRSSQESAVWVFEALALVGESRQATSRQDLLDRLLHHVVPACRAKEAAVLSYCRQQLDGCAAAGLTTAQANNLPDLEVPVLELRAISEAERWLLPLSSDRGDLVGVLYAAGPHLIDVQYGQMLARILGQALAGFVEIQSFSEAVHRLTFVEKFAGTTVWAATSDEHLAVGLKVLLDDTRADRAAILVAGTDAQLRTVVALGKNGRRLTGQFPHSRSICDWVMGNRAAISLQDVESSDSWKNRESILALGLRSVAAAPVMIGNEVIGVMYLDSESLLDSLGPSVGDLVETTAKLLAPVLARLESPATERESQC